jgi:Flp pilus assembly protein TadG
MLSSGQHHGRCEPQPFHEYDGEATMASRRAPQPRATDRGAAMVEFAFVGLLFVLLLTGIISFGLILAFKQNLTQAAAEGARAGATAAPSSVVADATTATQNAVSSFDRTCNLDGLTCTWTVEDCGEDPTDGVDDPALDNCITVELVYDYDGFPLIPKFPVLAAMYPPTLSSSSTSEVNPDLTTTAP